MSKERGDKPEMSKESGSVPISYKDYITKENFPSDEDIDDELTYTTLQKVVAPSDRKVKYKKPKLSQPMIWMSVLKTPPRPKSTTTCIVG